jgi:hypothetical protein
LPSDDFAVFSIFRVFMGGHPGMRGMTDFFVLSWLARTRAVPVQVTHSFIRQAAAGTEGRLPKFGHNGQWIDGLMYVHSGTENAVKVVTSE